MNREMFYAWAVPAFGGWLPNSDHTWVTTCHEVIDVDNVEGDYWYCLGDFHLTPPSNPRCRQLTLQEGDIDFARKIATPNDPHDDCGLRYGIHGVCHQMANRILYATAIDGREPAKVRDARGYNLSVTYYGEYGGGSNQHPAMLRDDDILRAWDRITQRFLNQQRV